jgi:hypothetical protein
MITTPYVLAALIAIVGSTQQVHVDRQIQSARDLQVGDSESRVLALLGPPRHDWEDKFALLLPAKGPRRWIYGADIELKWIIDPDTVFPHVLPLKLRLFGAYADDLVIVWDDKGRIYRIDLPPPKTPLQAVQ